MSTAVICITDGRWQCLERTIASFDETVVGDVVERYIYVDTNVESYREQVSDAFGGTWRVFWHPKGRQGFAGAIHYAWKEVLARTRCDWMFHLEDDFAFVRPVLLAELQNVLCENPTVAQMALRRQPWNPAEVEAGGVVQLHPEAYKLHRGVGREPSWLEHELFWTTNPSLFRTSLADHYHWPIVQHSEGMFTRTLLDDGWRFGYWGGFYEDPHVEHIGTERVGNGY